MCLYGHSSGERVLIHVSVHVCCVWLGSSAWHLRVRVAARQQADDVKCSSLLGVHVSPRKHAETLCNSMRERSLLSESMQRHHATAWDSNHFLHLPLTQQVMPNAYSGLQRSQPHILSAHFERPCFQTQIVMANHVRSSELRNLMCTPSGTGVASQSRKI